MNVSLLPKPPGVNESVPAERGPEPIHTRIEKELSHLDSLLLNLRFLFL